MLDFVNFDYFILLRLVVAVILGGIIGFERGGNNHDAGLRTHIIVCLGAASVMVVSECIVRQYNITTEIMRMGAQVVIGVGFLGVGSIIFDGNKIRGITTAAGLWTTASIGIAVGSGYYIVAISIVALMLFAMLGLRSVTKKIARRSSIYEIKVELEDREAVKSILKTLISESVEIKSVKFEEKDNNKINALLEIKIPRKSDKEKLISEVGTLEGVLEFTSL